MFTYKFAPVFSAARVYAMWNASQFKFVWLAAILVLDCVPIALTIVRPTGLFEGHLYKIRSTVRLDPHAFGICRSAKLSMHPVYNHVESSVCEVCLNN